MQQGQPRGGFLDLSSTGRGRVYFGTAFGAIGCALVALAVDSLNFHTLDSSQLLRSIAMDVLIPLGLATPILYILLSRMRELALAKERLAHLAATDSLTGLMNRPAFTDIVERSLATSHREELPRGALLVLDADKFKAINDQFGHAQGDTALQLLAGAMSRALRPNDRLGRIGGEEFAIYLPGLSLLAAETVAERIRHAVAAAEFTPEGKAVQLTVSIGGAAFDHPTDFTTLFRVADQQLYRAKSAGRNQVAFATVLADDPARAAA